MNGLPDEDTETMNQYNDYSAEQLKAALQRLLLYSDLEDQDVEEMEKILAVLREKTPFEHPRTAEEMWAEFKAEHAEEIASLGIHEKKDTEEVIEKEPVAAELRAESESTMPRLKSVRGVLRVAMIAAAMVVFIILATVTASAFGYDLWSWVPRWNDSTFRFVPEDTESATSLDIPEALKQLGIEEPLFPTWLPEGFVLDEQQIQLDDPVLIFAMYLCENRTITIIIRPLTEESQVITVEKDNNESLEYSLHNVDHYIFTNNCQSTSSWITNGYQVKISGEVSIDEMKAMIDSIYSEVNK